MSQQDFGNHARNAPPSAVVPVISPQELETRLRGMSAPRVEKPRGLAGKSRALMVTIVNQTQFELVYKDEYFDSGRFETRPASIPPFNDHTFSGCEKDGSLFTGVSGGVRFVIGLPGREGPAFGVGFSNPYSGAAKASVVANGTARQAYDAIVSTPMTASVGPLAASGPDTLPLSLRFQLSSKAGPQARIVVTQQVSART